MPTGSAEAVPPVPFDHRPGVSQQRTCFLFEQGPYAMKVPEIAERLERRAIVLVGAQANGEQRARLIEPQEDGTPRIRIPDRGMIDRKEDGTERLLAADETSGLPHG